MSDLHEILADSLPFELNGKEYRFSKINLGMMADFEAAIAMRRLTRALKALGPEASHAERAELIHTQTTTVGLTDAMSAVYSAEGCRLMLYLSLKPNHPEITEDDVGRLITPAILPEMQALIDQLSDASALAEAGELSKKAETAGEEVGQASQQPSPSDTTTADGTSGS